MSRDGAQADPNAVRHEHDGFTAISASHFRWEERRLTQALDALDHGGRIPGELLGIDVARRRDGTPGD